MVLELHREIVIRYLRITLGARGFSTLARKTRVKNIDRGERGRGEREKPLASSALIYCFVRVLFELPLANQNVWNLVGEVKATPFGECFYQVSKQQSCQFHHVISLVISQSESDLNYNLK